MKKWILCLMLFLGASLYAEYGSLNGVVRGEADRPLAGANIIIKETAWGTVSRSDGTFQFNRLLPGRYHVMISFIGYQSVIVAVQVLPQQTAAIEVTLKVSPLPYADVNITSLRYQTDLKEVSMPLSAVTAEKIQATAPITVSDALKDEPGIAMQRDGIWGTAVTIRGLSRNSIVTLVDGNRIDTATDLAAGLSMFDLAHIERIEVIRSAASALYGSGAMGGVVNIITKEGWYQEKPYFKAALGGGYASSNKGTNGYFRLQGGSHQWYALVSGSMRQADDMRTPKGILPNSQFKDDNLSSNMAFKPGSHHELKWTYQYHKASDVGIPGGYPLFPTQAKVSYPEEKRELMSLEYSWKQIHRVLPKISFKVFSQDILREVENIPYQVTNIPASGDKPAQRVSVLGIYPGATHKTRGGQMQSEWLLWAKNYLVFGLDVWQKDYRGHRTKETRIDVLNEDGSIRSTKYRTIGELPLPDAFYRSIGLYAQNETRLLSERLILNLGGRLDQITTQNEQGLNPLYEIVDGVRNDQPAGQVVLWPEKTDRTFTWSGHLSTLWHATSALDFTLNLASSFRAPSLEERYQYIDLGKTVKIGDPALQPERGQYADIGMRLWTDRLRLSANLFYNDLQDLVVEKSGTYEGRPALIKSNVGQARLYGYDLRLDAAPLSKHTVWAIASYVKGEDTDLNTPLPQIPPLNGKIGLQSDVLPFVSLVATATLFADQNRIAAGETRTPGYTYYDLYLRSKPLHVKDIKIAMMLGIENLTDKAYRNHLATNRGLINVEPGRNVFINWRLEL